MKQFGEKDTSEQKLEELSLLLNESIKEFNDNYIKNDTKEKLLLEKVKYFQELVEIKDGDIINQIQRLEKGLAVITNVSESIARLKKEIESNKLIIQELEKNKINGEKPANINKEVSDDKFFAEAEEAKMAAKTSVQNIKKQRFIKLQEYK